MAELISEALQRAWLDFQNGLDLYLPRVLAMLAILLVGWLAAWILGFITLRVLRWVKFNALADRTGAAEVLRRAALPSPDVAAASVVFWLVWMVFMLSGLSSLGFPGMEGLASQFVIFLPRLVVGIVIFVVGMVLADLAWRATLLAAVNSRLPSARLLSGIVRWLVVALTIAMALEQIGVAKTVLLTAFGIAFGALMMGVGIAIGIGGGQLARRLLERQFPDQPADKPPPDRLSHL